VRGLCSVCVNEEANKASKKVKTDALLATLKERFPKISQQLQRCQRLEKKAGSEDEDAEAAEESDECLSPIKMQGEDI